MHRIRIVARLGQARRQASKNTVSCRDEDVLALSKRTEALKLAEQLLTEIELSTIAPPQIITKASRIARLLDDVEAMVWFKYELGGYPETLNSEATACAKRAGRTTTNKETGKPAYWTQTVGQLQADFDAGTLQLRSAADAPVSISSSNPSQFVGAPAGNAFERGQLRAYVSRQMGIITKVIGSVHGYVAEVELQLRFGQAVEGAFTLVRNTVDARIAELAPTAAVKFAAAYENASSGNSEHWANAASACRRLLKDVADTLRPVGPPVGKIAMTEDKYINRLVDWIINQKSMGETFRDVITSDLEDLGKRLDAFDDAGHKGAHAEVTQYEASRFITGTYLLIGDLLFLADRVEEKSSDADNAEKFDFWNYSPNPSKQDGS